MYDVTYYKHCCLTLKWICIYTNIFLLRSWYSAGLWKQNFTWISLAISSWDFTFLLALFLAWKLRNKFCVRKQVACAHILVTHKQYQWGSQVHFGCSKINSLRGSFDIIPSAIVRNAFWANIAVLQSAWSLACKFIPSVSGRTPPPPHNPPWRQRLSRI